MHHVHAEIITMDRLVRNCHMIPKFGLTKDRRWTQENVVDYCQSFLLNPYIDMHMFCMLKV
jgi:hypothetical protein